MTLWTGTSGFQYPEWKGLFYPADFPVSRMLAFYAGQFSTTEINYTFRSIPSAKTIDRWREVTPAEFRFSLKAPQRVTHFAKLRDCGGVLSAFQQAVSGLGKKIGPVLFQLPATFKKDAGLLREFLESIPAGMRAAFELRHDSWFDDDVFGILKKRNAALCLAETEEFKTPRVATADFGYLRLRREDYTARRIAAWAKFFREQENVWAEAFAYFKHEETCVGPKFAQMLIKQMAR